jgi:TusA-related sulfurtransferase
LGRVWETLLQEGFLRFYLFECKSVKEVFAVAEKVDARGLSCPQPVLMALAKIKETGSGEIEVLVDNEVSRENVSRAATGQGWQIADIKEADGEYSLTLRK